MDETQEASVYKNFLETLQKADGFSQRNPDMTLKPLAQEYDLDTAQSVPESIDEALMENLPPLSRLSADGELVSDYDRISLLGRGGMGEVHLAKQRSLHRTVALKQLLKNRKTDHAVRQLIEEARVAGSLEHPSILPVYALGVDEHGKPVVVMKRIVGQSWKERIAEEDDLNSDSYLTRNINILIRVCHAISYAHSRGVLHRDLKPENIMLGDFGEVYVVDWGIATQIESQVLFANFHHIAGTPSYMAPEMAVGDALEPRTDVFLLGACLHHILTGRSRYHGSDPISVLDKARLCEPYLYPEGLPKDLVAIIQKCTAKEPSERYPSVESFREALENYLKRRGAVRLCDTADTRVASLEKLNTDQDAAAVIETRNKLAEAKFAYEQALATWPNCEQAQRGLETVHRTTIDLELQNKNAKIARALIQGLPNPSESVNIQLEELERHEAKRRSLEAQGTRHDNTINVDRRRLFARVLTGVSAVLAAGALFWRYQGGVIDHTFGISVGLVTMAIYIGCTLLVVPRYIRDSYNQRLLAAVGIAFAFSLLFRVMAWWLELNILHSTKQEFFIWATWISVMAVGFRIKMWTNLFVLYALLTLATFSAYTYEIFWLSLVYVAFTFAGVISRQVPETTSQEDSIISGTQE